MTTVLSPSGSTSVTKWQHIGRNEGTATAETAPRATGSAGSSACRAAGRRPCRVPCRGAAATLAGGSAATRHPPSLRSRRVVATPRGRRQAPTAACRRIADMQGRVSVPRQAGGEVLRRIAGVPQPPCERPPSSRCRRQGCELASRLPTGTGTDGAAGGPSPRSGPRRAPWTPRAQRERDRTTVRSRVGVLRRIGHQRCCP